MHFFTALILFIIPTVTLASDNCKCQDPDGVQYDELTRQCCINVKLGLHYGNITPVHVYTDGDGEIDMKELSQDKKDWVYRYEQENAGPELAYEDTYHECKKHNFWDTLDDGRFVGCCQSLGAQGACCWD